MGSTIDGKKITSEAQVLADFGATKTEYGAYTPADVRWSSLSGRTRSSTAKSSRYWSRTGGRASEHSDLYRATFRVSALLKALRVMWKAAGPALLFIVVNMVVQAGLTYIDTQSGFSASFLIGLIVSAIMAMSLYAVLTACALHAVGPATSTVMARVRENLGIFTMWALVQWLLVFIAALIHPGWSCWSLCSRRSCRSRPWTDTATPSQSTSGLSAVMWVVAAHQPGAARRRSRALPARSREHVLRQGHAGLGVLLAGDRRGLVVAAHRVDIDLPQGPRRGLAVSRGMAHWLRNRP